MAIVAAKGRKVRRGVQAQMARRRLERATRIDIVAMARWARRFLGWSWEQTAARLRVTAATLRRWMSEWRDDRLAVEPRGRPLARAETEVRNQVCAALGLLGPGVSVRALQELFPLVARRELEDIVRRYRHVHRKRGALLHVVGWNNRSTVWAMDFTEAPTSIDGDYPYILVVRDLGSGKQLLALPAPGQTHRVVIDALRSLFAQHGAPLVLKSDQGSAFRHAETRAMLDEYGVLQLLSPPRTPKYNGACEAGIGGLRTRAHYLAARRGQPGAWSCDDVEGARLMANECTRPRGAAGPTPDELWACRNPCTEGDRVRLQRVARELITEERDRIRNDRGDVLARLEEQAAERIGIVRALQQLGHLHFRRRRFSLPFDRRRVIKIS